MANFGLLKIGGARFGGSELDRQSQRHGAGAEESHLCRWHRLSRCLFEEGDTCEECGMHRACSDFLLQWPVKLTRQGRIEGTSFLVVGNYT